MKGINDIDERTFERIEAYLDGRMEVEERIAFEIKMKAEPDLTEEVETQRMIRDSIEVGGMKEHLDQVHEKLYSQEVKNTQGMPNAWKIAASVLIILGVGAALMNWESKEEVLFAEYSRVDPGLPVPMSASGSYEFHDAMVEYKSKHYQSAIDKWSVLSTSAPDNDTLTYYINAALYNQSDYQMAISGLTPISVSETSAFRHRAQWYILLSHLALKNLDAVQSAPIDTDSPYLGRAKSLRIELQ